MIAVTIICTLVNIVFFVSLLKRKETMDVKPPLSNNLDPSTVLMYSRREVDALVARLNKRLCEVKNHDVVYEYALSPPPFELYSSDARRNQITSRNREIFSDLSKKMKGHKSIRAVISWTAYHGSTQERELQLTGEPETIVSQIVSMIESWANFTGGTFSLSVKMPSVEPELPSKIEVVYLNALGKPETEDIEDRVAAMVEVELATERARLKAGNNTRLVN